MLFFELNCVNKICILKIIYFILPTSIPCTRLDTASSAVGCMPQEALRVVSRFPHFCGWGSFPHLVALLLFLILISHFLICSLVPLRFLLDLCLFPIHLSSPVSFCVFLLRLLIARRIMGSLMRSQFRTFILSWSRVHCWFKLKRNWYLVGSCPLNS